MPPLNSSKRWILVFWFLILTGATKSLESILFSENILFESCLFRRISNCDKSLTREGRDANHLEALS